MAFPMKKAAAAGPSAYTSKKAGVKPVKTPAMKPKKGVAKTLGSQFMAEGANC